MPHAECSTCHRVTVLCDGRCQRCNPQPSKRPKPPRNRVRCLACNEVIESCSGHDFRRCSCKATAVDGGPSLRVGRVIYGPSGYARVNEDGTETKRGVQHG